MGILTFVMLNSSDKGDKMALITFFTLLPFLLFGPVFGVFVDRYSRKNLMLFADLSRAILVALIPLLWINTHSVILMIFWFFILGSLTALFTPAKMSIVTNITDKDVLLEANSLIVSTGMVATLVGTLIAGLAIKAAGIKTAFYINSLTYIISALFILRIIYKKSSPLNAFTENTYFTLIQDIKAGMNYIRRHSLIMSLIILSGIFSFVASFSYILILNYGSVVLKQSPLGMGMLLSSAGFGMIVGSLILIKRKDKINYRRALYLSYLIVGIFSLGFIFNPGFFITLIILFCAGIGASIITIALDTIFQRITPDELKGKVFAARGLLTNSIFLSCLLLVGHLIKYIDVTNLFGIVGIVGLLTFLGVFLFERRWGYALLLMFLRLLMKLLFDFKVSGLENLPKTKRVILAANHTSVVDGVALACAYKERMYFLAIDSLFKAKFWGWCAKRLGYIPVKRGGFNKEALREAAKIIKSGYAVGIFPEGKIAHDGCLEEGKSGMALIARLSGVDIIPCAIEGAYEAWPLSKKFPRRFPIEVRFGKPIDIKDYPVQGELVSEVMQEIAEVKLQLEREGYLRVEPNEIIKHLINIG